MTHARVPTLQRLAISCAPEGGPQPWRFARVEGPDPAQVLEGRAPQEAAALAPRIFNLCGAAHGFAAARALGLPAGDAAAAMAWESVRDHALAVLHGWPALLDGPPDRAALGQLSHPGPVAADALRTALLGAGLAACDFGALSPAELGAWLDAGPSATARILARLRRQLDPAEGRAGLPELGLVDLELALETAPLPAEPPTSSLPLRETGALGRVAATPLFAALLADEGPSLFVRLLARLADLLALLGGARLACPQTPSGLGVAEAARGLLGHGAQVEDGRVTRYRILPPSLWNLAPGGLLERAFATLPPGPEAPVRARFLLSAINPCVPVTLDFSGALSHA